MKILVINAGSSSLKYQLIDMQNEHVLAKGICEQIGDSNATFTHKVPSDESKNIKESHLMDDHNAAIHLVLDTLVSKDHGVIESTDEIRAVGHRVLHGGEKFSSSVLVTDAVKEAIKECFKFGPLHNPANFKGIEACEKIMPVPQVAVFDTGFHQTMPDYAYLYALPYEFYEKDGIRRYGFHGTSHRYVSGRCIELLGGKAEGTKIVTCHLGNGSSIAAVKDGKCLDTTMGLTPLEGILMGTRCGSIDPAIVTTIMKSRNLTPDEMDTLMNKKSGMLGLAGTSDNRTIENRAKTGDERAMLVESMLCHQLAKYIGGFAAAMGGIDAVVFTGGIGENNPQYRTRIADSLRFLGTDIDEEKNHLRGEEVEISVPGSKLKMYVIPTNEELVIARDTLNIVQSL
ncbi:MAG: acetate kinase [Clostridia bacterium]|nr:acetate kinase [Clostridia bacterium]MBQ4244486.1 acetate kinase [Clostridia bacterium]